MKCLIWCKLILLLDTIKTKLLEKWTPEKEKKEIALTWIVSEPREFNGGRKGQESAYNEGALSLVGWGRKSEHEKDKVDCKSWRV